MPEAPANFAAKVAEYLLIHDIDVPGFVSGWFHGAPLESIRRENMIEFLSYGLFYSRPEDLDAAVQGDVLDMLAKLEAKCHYRFAPGHNPELEFMNHLWQVKTGASG